uniref:Uncharacterized protein n=1 Tax=Oryza rufipogon TaxID=4529 RepID=A0A0E0R5P3_ORYRU
MHNVATRRVSGAAGRPARYSVLSACRTHRRPEIASLPLIGDVGRRSRDENAGRSATTRCPQGVTSSSYVASHLVGVAGDVVEPPESVDDATLPSDARHHPLLAGDGFCHFASPKHAKGTRGSR